MSVVRLTLQSVEDAIVLFPSLAIKLLSKPVHLIGAIVLVVVGEIWLKVGAFLVEHITIIRFIFATLAETSKITSEVFSIFTGVVEKAINAVSSVGNIGGGAINAVSGFFGGSSHVVPTIPKIPDDSFPVIDFTSYVQYFDDIKDAAGKCGLFESVSYELAFPLRYVLNDKVCPVVRYNYGTLVSRPLNFFLALFFFDADPNGNNCQVPLASWTCFTLQFGLILSMVVAPLMIFFWLFPILKSLISDLLHLTKTLLKLLLSLLVGVAHTLHRAPSKPKKRN